MKSTSRFATALALAGLLFVAPACSLLRDAKIAKMTPGGQLMTGSLECWIELVFSGEPAGDPRDVVLEFESVVMPAREKFDWSYIASHDKVRRGDFAGYRTNEVTRAELDPPLDTTILFRVPLRAHQRLELDAGDSLELTATLYWGGEKQHSVSRTLGHVYRNENSAL